MTNTFLPSKKPCNGHTHQKENLSETDSVPSVLTCRYGMLYFKTKKTRKKTKLTKMERDKTNDKRNQALTAVRVLN